MALHTAVHIWYGGRAMTSVKPSNDAPTVDEVKRISAITDPVIRNLRITECYSRLSAAIGKRTGPCANWCTFATWASKQAGQTIRGEDLLDKFAALSNRDTDLFHPVQSFWAWLVRRGLFRPDTRLGRLVHAIHGPLDAFELSSDAVARGNKKVFEEIGLEFARYVELCPPGVTIESDEFQSFQNGLRDGDPPEGQGRLRFAFQRYQLQSNDRIKLAQNILMANLQIGFHEQTRLQPEIREALEAAPAAADELGWLALKALFPGIRFGRPAQLIAALLHIPASRFQKYVGDLTCRIVTNALMVLTLPRETLLDLHRNLEVPYPESLIHVDDEELAQFLAFCEPPNRTDDDCGARDWSDLSQRIHFIAHLFRAFQESPDLFGAPFTAEQVRALMEGRVPTGKL